MERLNQHDKDFIAAMCGSLALWGVPALIVLMLLTGCQSKSLHITRHTDGSIQVDYTKSQVLNSDSLEAVEITKDGDSYTVEVRGMTSESQANGAIAEGVARGLSGVAK